MTELRVLLADGRRLIRACLAQALEDAGAGLRIVSEVGDDRAALAEAIRTRPDVTILAADLPAGDGIRTCAAVKAANVPTRVVILAPGEDRGLLLGAVEAGADGYVTGSMSVAELAATVHRIAEGEASVPSAMLGVLLQDLIRRRREEDAVLDRFARLSRREKQVFSLLVEGNDHRGIASALVVSPHTARTHIQNVLEKLGVHSRLEAANLAMEYNLMERFAVVEDAP